jgi:hypothetical protein
MSGFGVPLPILRLRYYWHVVETSRTYPNGGLFSSGHMRIIPLSPLKLFGGHEL